LLVPVIPLAQDRTRLETSPVPSFTTRTLIPRWSTYVSITVLAGRRENLVGVAVDDLPGVSIAPKDHGDPQANGDERLHEPATGRERSEPADTATTSGTC
jgi:hypothetical protein